MDSNTLFKTDKCSPLISYFIIILIHAVLIYTTYSNFKKLNNTKIDNVFTMFSLYEVCFLLSIGILLLGLCQYNQTLLAWIVLFIPMLVFVIKLVVIFITVSNINKSIPSDEELNKHQQINQKLDPNTLPIPQPPSINSSQNMHQSYPNTTSISELNGSAPVNGSAPLNGAPFNQGMNPPLNSNSNFNSPSPW